MVTITYASIFLTLWILSVYVRSFIFTLLIVSTLLNVGKNGNLILALTLNDVLIEYDGECENYM
jgi:hypothetical protein